MQLIDPPDGSPEYAGQAYDYLKGKMGTVGRYLKRPDSSIIKYYFSGDPVAGTGELPANFPLGPYSPQCAYPRPNSGPFTLAMGDTQEVVAALVISQGTDNLNSVTLLKQDVATLRDQYESGIVVNVADRDRPLPERFSLAQNYPNPFNPTTTIEFALPTSSHVVLRVYNILGEEIATLVEGHMEAGYHQASFREQGLASGVYLYRLSVGSFTATKKLMLLK